MKKIFQSYYSFLALCSLFLLPINKVQAQSVTFDNVNFKTSDGNTGGGVCFNFTTNALITLEHVRCNINTTNGTAIVWYNPNKIAGQPVINAANGWINLGTTQVTGLASTTNRDVLTTIPVLMNVDMNPGDTIGIAIQWTGNHYPSMNVNTPTFTDGTVTMIADAGSAFSFNNALTTFYNPRQIHGGVVYKLKSMGANDIGVRKLETPVNFCNGTQNISVRVQNFGNNYVNSGVVNWSLDGVLQTPISLAMSLDTLNGAMANDTVVTLGSYVFNNSAVTLKAWTTMPNGVTDTANINDTLVSVLQPSLSGLYTVNNALPTGGTNFQTLNALSNALSTVGVCGPVVVDVVANSGPYTGKFVLEDIPGASAINTVRINGNNNVVSVATAATNGAREMLLLDNAHYVTVNNLQFTTTGAAAWGALVTGGSTNDSIINCKFDLSNIVSTASASNAGIVLSGTNAAAAAAGASGKHIYIGNNHILGSAAAGGVYYGVGLNAEADSNIVSRNNIENFYYAGVYLGINQHNTIEFNNIHRSNKTAGFASTYGIYAVSGASSNHLINGNKIHSFADMSATSTSITYGIYWLADGTINEPNIISNNDLYNLKGGTTYGIGLSAAVETRVFNNTINFNVNTGSANVNYGLYSTGASTGSKFYNNNVVFTAGGTGTKYGFYYASANSIADAQKNNIFMNSSNAGTQNYGYYVTNYGTQIAFNMAYPTLEVGSPSVDPLFINPTVGDYTPLNAALLSRGINTGGLVPEDINGRFRPPFPTIGAYEKDLTASNNLGLISFIGVDGPYCVDSQEVKISLVNFGVNDITSFKITGSYNNIPLDTIVYTQTLTTVLGNSTNAFDTVVFKRLMVDANINDLKVWVVSVNDTIDGDSLDDSLNIKLQGSTFNLLASEDTVCGSGMVKFTIAPKVENGSAVWESSLDGVNWNTVNGVTGSTYTVAVLDELFVRAKLTKGVTGCMTNDKYVVYFTPQLNLAQGDTNCVGDKLNLVAKANNGAALYWYNSITSDSVLFIGDTLSLAGLSVTDTYYVQAVANKSVGAVGPLNTYMNTPATSSNTYSTNFSVHKNVTLKSVDVYAATRNLSSSIIITNTETNQIVGTYAFTTANIGTAVANANVIDMNIDLAPGEYSMSLANAISLYRNATGASYPYVSAPITINGHSNSFTPASVDFYSFYNWKFETGCAAPKVPVVATVLETPVVDLGANIDACYNVGEFEFLNAQNPNAAYLWDNGITTQVRLVDQTGSYWVLVTNPNGCFSSDTINVIYKNNPVSLLPTDTSVCNNTLVTLNVGAGGIQYFWSNGATTPTTTVRRAGVYNVQVVGDNGCVLSDSVNVIMLGEAPSFDNIQARNVNSNTFKFRLINPQYITQTRWDFGDGNVSYDLEPTHSFDSNGNYTVVVSTESTCGSATDTITIHIKGFTDINELAVDKSIKLYPNPAQDLITIESIITNDRLESIQVFDITGKVIMTQKVDQATTTQLNISHLAAGMYFVNITTNSGTYKAKVDKL